MSRASDVKTSGSSGVDTDLDVSRNAQAERREDPNEQGTQGLTAVSDEELQVSLVLR